MTVHEIHPPDAREALVRRLEERVRELEAEARKGERFVAELQEQERAARELLLRIEGAVQVLREEIAHARADGETASTDSAVSRAVAGAG